MAILAGNALVAVCGVRYSLCSLAGAAGTKTQVIRRGEGTKVVAEQAHYRAILLAAQLAGARRDIYLLLTQPGADRISTAASTGSVEHTSS